MKPNRTSVAAVVMLSSVAVAQAGTVFALDLRANPNRLITFPSNAPALNVGPNVTPDSFAMDFDATGTTLYIITPGTPAPYNVGTLNTTTGVVTPGPTITEASGTLAGQTVTGLSYDPQTQNFYMTANSAAAGNTIYTLNVQTGVATLGPTITGLVAGGIIIDIAISLEGQMYGHEIAADQLVKINKNDGVAQVLGSTGQLANFAQGMDFDYDTNELYATVYTGGGTGVYAKFNLNTGLAEVIASTTAWNAEMEMAINSPVPSTPCPGDLNGDNVVDQSDLGILLAAFNVNGNGDLDGDGDTDQSDLGILLSHFGESC
ncbi:MAG TPA: hypothetical protein PKC49_02075 [Phycisphaerae bacterium]|nr:hypothetical protein [Phycisphaerae bacterium]